MIINLMRSLVDCVKFVFKFYRDLNVLIGIKKSMIKPLMKMLSHKADPGFRSASNSCGSGSGVFKYADPGLDFEKKIDMKKSKRALHPDENADADHGTPKLLIHC